MKRTDSKLTHTARSLGIYASGVVVPRMAEKEDVEEFIDPKLRHHNQVGSIEREVKNRSIITLVALLKIYV